MKICVVYFTVIVTTCIDRFDAYQGEFDNTIYDDFNDNAMAFDEDAYLNEMRAVRNASLGYPDSINGRVLDNWDPASGVRAHELGNYYQGDILHVPDTTGRSGIPGDRWRWPGKIVYYKISPLFSAQDRSRIMHAINQYNTRTCIKMVQAGPNNRDFVNVIKSQSGCFSSIGRVGGAQTLNLQSPGCLYYIGTIVHEFLHAVGFFHEQARTDRDQYVTIYRQNIIPAMISQFDIARNSIHFNIPYDYASVMHYSEKAFSRNNQVTIAAKRKGVRLGNDQGLTASDIRKIKAMYRC